MAGFGQVLGCAQMSWRKLVGAAKLPAPGWRVFRGALRSLPNRPRCRDGPVEWNPRWGERHDANLLLSHSTRHDKLCARVWRWWGRWVFLLWDWRHHLQRQRRDPGDHNHRHDFWPDAGHLGPSSSQIGLRLAGRPHSQATKLTLRSSLLTRVSTSTAGGTRIAWPQSTAGRFTLNSPPTLWRCAHLPTRPL